MPDAHRRKKQPEVLRTQLLRSAAEIAAGQGVNAVTLDAVARRAGVSKGGLQHHFRSKQALLDALFLELAERFNDDIAAEVADDPDDHGRAARAYLRVTSREASREDATLMRALVAVMLTEPASRERWAPLFAEMTRPDPLSEQEAARLMICRLAADGLWISELLGYQAMSPTLKAEVMRQLERMSRA